MPDSDLSKAEEAWRKRSLFRSRSSPARRPGRLLLLLVAGAAVVAGLLLTVPEALDEVTSLDRAGAPSPMNF
jgi:hypothetical protein